MSVKRKVTVPPGSFRIAIDDRAGPQCVPVARQSAPSPGGSQRLPDERGRGPGIFNALHCTQRSNLGSAERHRSRTCLASGYDAVLVLKTRSTQPGVYLVRIAFA